MNCPRCDHDDIKVIAKSPEGDVWEIYCCQKCFYSWRSTENITIIDRFKLNDEKIKNMQVVPPIPPLKEK